MLSLYLSVNADENISSVYTWGITVRKEAMKKNKKYNDVSFLQTKLLTNLNSLVKSVCNI
jgi:hypothetical protein